MMTQAKPSKAQKIAALQRKLLEVESQLAHVYHFAAAGIKNANRQKTMASGVVVQLHYLGGREVCPAFTVKDGFSDEAIAALCADIIYSYNLTTQLKPKGV